jgi:copper transporter 1
MDHGHGGHGDGGMDMGPTCSMHMLWNTQIEDTCIVFRQWHISSHFIFALSFIAIILISLGYEYLRAYQRSVDRRIAQALSRGKGRDRSAPSYCTVPFYPRVLRAALYGSQVFVSFFLMLVFMTYNAYLILAVVLGASIGHFVFGAVMDVESVLAGGDLSKGMACH